MCIRDSPYSSVVDSTIVVKESELKDLYNKQKEQFKQYQEDVYKRQAR